MPGGAAVGPFQQCGCGLRSIFGLEKLVLCQVGTFWLCGRHLGDARHLQRNTECSTLDDVEVYAMQELDGVVACVTVA